MARDLVSLFLNYSGSVCFRELNASVLGTVVLQGML